MYLVRADLISHDTKYFMFLECATTVTKFVLSELTLIAGKRYALFEYSYPTTEKSSVVYNMLTVSV